MREITVEQRYFRDLAWENLRLAWKCYDVGRWAKAQEYYREALYYDQKVPKVFTEIEFQENITRLGNQIFRGY